MRQKRGSLPEGQHPDVFWIEPKGLSASIKIEDIRNLKERINFKPYEAQVKIFIIQDAQRLTPPSANALLKALEEPPADTILILIAESASQLLPTVVSRCRLIRFPHRKFSSLEQTGLIDRLASRVFSKSAQLKADDFWQERKLLEDIAALERNQIEQLLQELAFIFRDILIIKLGPSNRIFMSRQAPEFLTGSAGIFNVEALTYLLDETLQVKNYIKQNANIKLCIDLLIKRIQSYRKTKTTLSLSHHE